MTVAEISPVPREARPYQGEHAGLVTRLLANAVDALVCAAALLVAYALFNVAKLIVNPRSFHLSAASVFFDVVTAMLVFTVYAATSWAVTGRTYGCHVMGLRVVGRGGGRVRPVVAFLRAVLSVAVPVGLLLCAGGRSRRSLADVALRTAVIYDWSPRGAPAPAVPDDPGADAATDTTRDITTDTTTGTTTGTASDPAGRAWGQRGPLDA